MKTLELKLKKDVLIVDLEDNEATHIEGYELLCEGSELTEEIASELVEVDYSNFQSDDENYELKKNYVKDTFEFMSFEESFISAVESKSFYWLENPFKDWRSDGEIHDDDLDLIHKEAEEKTFKNPLIFVKNE